MKTLTGLSLLISIAYFMASCTEDDPSGSDETIQEPDSIIIQIVTDTIEVASGFDPVYQVPDSVTQARINAFIAEAGIRNVQIDTSNLLITYDSTTLDADVHSLITPVPQEGEIFQKELIINTKSNSIPWTNSTQQETWWFHVLGHLLLDRENDNSKLSDNKHPKSIMVEGDLTMYSLCLYPEDNDAVECSASFKRDYYMDELFDPETPEPSWINQSTN